MRVTDPVSVSHEVAGLIEHIDVPRRELTLLVDGMSQVFGLATDCACLLHGERVKLRLLMPMDYAKVAYRLTPEEKTAYLIHVHWWMPLSEEVERGRASRAAAIARASVPTAPEHGVGAALQAGRREAIGGPNRGNAPRAARENGE